MIGKRYMRGCTKILGPAQKKQPKAVKPLEPEVKTGTVDGMDVLDE
jgi:hypothetical protein